MMGESVKRIVIHNEAAAAQPCELPARRRIDVTLIIEKLLYDG